MRTASHSIAVLVTALWLAGCNSGSSLQGFISEHEWQMAGIGQTGTESGVFTGGDDVRMEMVSGNLHIEGLGISMIYPVVVTGDSTFDVDVSKEVYRDHPIPEMTRALPVIVEVKTTVAEDSGTSIAVSELSFFTDTIEIVNRHSDKIDPVELLSTFSREDRENKLFYFTRLECVRERDGTVKSINPSYPCDQIDWS